MIQNRTLTWVQGEAGANAYCVAPNSTIDLWDTEKQTIYIKSSDMYGIPSIIAVDYVFRDAQAQQNEVSKEKPYYATLEDFKALNERICALEGKRKGKKNESVISDDDE